MKILFKALISEAGRRRGASRDGECRVAVCRYVNAAASAILGLYFFIIPGLLVLRYVNDPGLRGAGIPRLAWDVHRHLTPRYERWARARIASGKAAHLQLYDVPSTEWPIFGSVFYLWATEALQQGWEQDRSAAPRPPREYARGAIDASLDLILDPGHHTWVKTHWGEDYLHRENVFFRGLIIAGISSHSRLTGSQAHYDLLRDQVESLSRELDASPTGLLNDYPQECYPVDVFAATYLIRQADALLGTDHGAFVERERRAFDGKLLDDLGLIPYCVIPEDGTILQPSRGIGNSYVSIFAPHLYPAQAAQWYDLYARHFWQRRLMAEGFREFSRGARESEFTYDVDAGPVIAGFSPAANAYGVAAARANGRFDHAYVLGAQVIGACWPLADGTLLGARFLSNAAHAPYLGEANLLFLLTRQPALGVKIVPGGHLPGFFYWELGFYFGLGLLVLCGSYRSLAAWRRTRDTEVVAWLRVQFGLWMLLMAAGMLLLTLGRLGPGVLALLLAQLLPRSSRSTPRCPAPGTTPT